MFWNIGNEKLRNALIPRETNVTEVLEHHLHPLIESLLYLHVIIRNNCNNLTVHVTHLNKAFQPTYILTIRVLRAKPVVPGPNESKLGPARTGSKNWQSVDPHWLQLYLYALKLMNVYFNGRIQKIC